jgi:hypothetical protein
MGLGMVTNCYRGSGEWLGERGAWTLGRKGRILPSVFALLSKIGFSSQNMADRYIGDRNFLTVKFCYERGPIYERLLRT